LYRASLGKYFVDEIYDATIVRPLRVTGGICYQVGDQLLVDGLGVGGVSSAVGATGDRIRRWHNGNVRRYLAVLMLGVGLVLASVFANPMVSQVGPSPVHPVDLGGLRPTLGGQSMTLKGPSWFTGEPWFSIHLGGARPRRSPAPVAMPAGTGGPPGGDAPRPPTGPSFKAGPAAQGDRKANGGAP